MHRLTRLTLSLLFLASAAFAPAVCAPPAPAPIPWQPATGPLMTQWAAEVDPGNALTEYPRPQMARAGWLNLNGLWEYAIRPREESPPVTFDGQILVPFAVESALSGVMQRVGEDNRLWYRRQFQATDTSGGNRASSMWFDPPCGSRSRPTTTTTTLV